jgi:isocitrate dehydrogenase
VGTKEFAQAVIANLGQRPTVLKAVAYASGRLCNCPSISARLATQKDSVGVDVFVHWAGTCPQMIWPSRSKAIESCDGLKLSMITNRGIKIWPDGFPETFCTDHWRCRFQNVNNSPITKQQIINLL